MMFATTHRAVADIVSESALKVDSGREIPYHTGDLNLHQYCAYLTHMHTGMSVHSQTHTQTHARTHTCTHTHTHTHSTVKHTHTDTCTHTHTHTHTHTEEEITGLNAILPLHSSTPPPIPHPLQTNLQEMLRQTCRMWSRWARTWSTLGWSFLLSFVLPAKCVC